MKRLLCTGSSVTQRRGEGSPDPCFWLIPVSAAVYFLCRGRRMKVMVCNVSFQKHSRVHFTVYEFACSTYISFDVMFLFVSSCFDYCVFPELTLPLPNERKRPLSILKIWKSKGEAEDMTESVDYRRRGRWYTYWKEFSTSCTFRAIYMSGSVHILLAAYECTFHSPFGYPSAHISSKPLGVSLSIE